MKDKNKSLKSIVTTGTPFLIAVVPSVVSLMLKTNCMIANLKRRTTDESQAERNS